jgi:phage gpG-like protein
MADRIRFNVDVDGVTKVIASLQKFNVKSRDLAAAWADIGAKVKTDALPLVNTRTGMLERSIRAGKTKTRAVVRAGKSTVPYAGVIHYGQYTPPHAHSEIQANPFLVEARDKNLPYAVRRVDRELTKLIYQFGLK